MDLRCSDDPSRRDIPSFIEPRPPLIQNPFMRPRPQKGTNLLEQFEEDESEVEEPELVQVYLRMKPCDVPSKLYEVRSDKCLVASLDTTTAGHGRRTQHNVSRMYTFSRIFNSDCSQKEIFEQVVKNNLKKLVEGHSFTLLTYGASGSGKTYTLMGTVASPGLIPRSLEYVFKLVDAAQMPMYKPSDNGADLLEYAHQEYEIQWVKRLRHVSAPLRDKYRRMSAQLNSDLTVSNIDLTNRAKYYVWVSFVEIYNEAIYDLLAPPDKRVKMRLREDSSGNVYVKGVTQAFVRSGEEAYDVMVAGKHNLIVAATGIHAHSSRSHCIFTITMLSENDGEIRTSHVRLCDLAGCERQRATNNTGARMQESRAINSSLHVLERCLHMLRRKQRLDKESLVPYRESKLTRLLGSGLSGSRGEAVSMVVTLNPAPRYAHETKHVLSLACVAQDIQINNTMYASTLSTLESSTQDTTIYSNAETMRLRADNERLHFELAQAQTRNKELLGSMEDTQRKTANTMREIVAETKDMMREYYESQIDSLKAQMAEMAETIEEFESKSDKMPTFVTGAGTPSRFLQKKVEQLMREVAVLEEKLSEERLARARAEKEVQHLRDCIEERDEKAFKEVTSSDQDDEITDKALKECTDSQDEIILTDSENESDKESTDPLNESLEPIFKKDRSLYVGWVSKNLETSKIIQDTLQETVKENEEQDSISDKDVMCETFKNEDSDKVMQATEHYTTFQEVQDTLQETVKENKEQVMNTDVDKSCDSLKREDSDVISKDSMYATGDEECEIVAETNNTSNSLANLTETIGRNYKEISGRILLTDKMSVSNVDKDKSEHEDFFNASIKVLEKTQDVVKSSVPSSLRGTNSVKHEEPIKEYLNDNLKSNKNINIARGTYFVEESASILGKSSDFAKGDSEKKNSNPKQETLVNKILKSLKTSNSSDSSLTQFEQLEMAVKSVDNSKDKSTDLVNVNIFKKKGKYFDDTDKHASSLTSTDKPSFIKNLPAVNEKECGNNTETNAKMQFKSKYYKGENYEREFSLSKAAKIQEKVLFFDSKKTVSKFLTNDEKQSLSSLIGGKSGDRLDMKSRATNKKEKQLYFDENDKTSSNDVLISSSSTKKRTYFDNTDLNIEPAVNKKLNDIIIHSLKDQDRSPSIIKDDVHKDYKPSSVMMKLLGDSVTKPEPEELLSSIHKKIMKKHESTDIFESPQVNVAKAKEVVLGNNELFNKNIKIAEEFNNLEGPLSKKTKELSDVDTVRKSIEQLVLEPKLVDIKPEIKIQPASFDIETEENNETGQIPNLDLKYGQSKDKTDDIEKPTDTQMSKVNETLDEFENIVNNMSSIRATQFDLLLTDEVGSFNIQDKPKENESVKSESTKDNDIVHITEKVKEYSIREISDRTKSESTKNNDIAHVTEKAKEYSIKEITDKIKSESTKDNNIVQITEKTKECSIREISDKTKEFEAMKYNLRHKGKSVNQNINDEKQEKKEEENLPEPKTRTTTKKSLRLKRVKNKIDNDSNQDNETKLKDLINLKKEFCDVTMDLPLVKKDVKDIPSPEKLAEEEENLPPMIGIQSCPSKSVTRSRRKLFTPRAEPLEESPGQAADSNERLCVPRPSYHRSRVRRKL